MTVFDQRPCRLGEGPLWHPVRKQLFWFDILSKQLLTQDADGPRTWQFDNYVSAAGWIDHDTLLIADEVGLHRFDIPTGDTNLVCALEADNPITRSNDGRADPYGGFWIGTMGKNTEPSAGAIYRYYRGEQRKLFGDITISNSICFSPGGDLAHFCDTKKACIMSVDLDPDKGWPIGAPRVFVDLSDEGLNPDGAVVDAQGCLWSAQWGAGRVARYDEKGEFLSAVSVGGVQASCPAFGGAKLDTLFVTTAKVGLDGDKDGLTYAVKVDAVGQAEHRVIL